VSEFRESAELVRQSSDAIKAGKSQEPREGKPHLRWGLLIIACVTLAAFALGVGLTADPGVGWLLGVVVALVVTLCVRR
jgi:hypothetical protein